MQECQLEASKSSSFRITGKIRTVNCLYCVEYALVELFFPPLKTRSGVSKGGGRPSPQTFELNYILDRPNKRPLALIHYSPMPR